jgi:hypothetical protein
VDTTIFAEALEQILRKYPGNGSYLELKAFSERYDSL